MSGDKKDNIALMFLGGLPNGENFELYKLWFAPNIKEKFNVFVHPQYREDYEKEDDYKNFKTIRNVVITNEHTGTDRGGFLSSQRCYFS